MKVQSPPQNKETFQLLHLSDDSKSLSDLELPEIINQRKRKVRRKTRPRPPANNRYQVVNNHNQCNRLIVWVAIFLSTCWLLTLSYMMAVIHAENLRLGVQINKPSVTSQNLQQALQKWHEISKNLEQNQTEMYGKILELRRNLDNLSSDFSQYKEKYLNEKKDYSKDEKVVANFGAKLASIDGDVDLIKDRFDEIQKEQTSLKDSLTELRTNFSDTINRTTVYNSFNNTNCTEEILNTKKVLLEQIQQLSTNLSNVNNYLTQKTTNFQEELVSYHKNLENLTDTSAKTTSHVESIEADWIKYKNKILELQNSTSYLNNIIKEVQSECNKYHAQALDMNLSNSRTSIKDKDINHINLIKTGKLDLPQISPLNSQNVTAHKEDVQQPQQQQPTQNSSANKITTESSVAGKPKLLSIQEIKEITKQLD